LILVLLLDMLETLALCKCQRWRLDEIEEEAGGKGVVEGKSFVGSFSRRVK